MLIVRWFVCPGKYCRLRIREQARKPPLWRNLQKVASLKQTGFRLQRRPSPWPCSMVVHRRTVTVGVVPPLSRSTLLVSLSDTKDCMWGVANAALCSLFDNRSMLAVCRFFGFVRGRTQLLSIYAVLPKSLSTRHNASHSAHAGWRHSWNTLKANCTVWVALPPYGCLHPDPIRQRRSLQLSDENILLFLSSYKCSWCWVSQLFNSSSCSRVCAIALNLFCIVIRSRTEKMSMQSLRKHSHFCTIERSDFFSVHSCVRRERRWGGGGGGVEWVTSFHVVIFPQFHTANCLANSVVKY